MPYRMRVDWKFALFLFFFVAAVILFIKEHESYGTGVYKYICIFKKIQQEVEEDLRRMRTVMAETRGGRIRLLDAVQE